MGVSHLLNFQYGAFCRWLTKNEKLCFCTYCIGEISSQETNLKIQKLYESQSVLFAKLHEQRIKVKRGFMLRSGDRFIEKGVDVQIATDILVGAYENLYDVAYLVSSDSDLLPAILKARGRGKEIVYVGFRHAPSQALRYNCSRSFMLEARHVAQFCAS